MANVLYVDCQNGISGDMSVAAFLDSGMPINYLRKFLKSLNIKAQIKEKTVLRGFLKANKFDVICKNDHGHDINEIYQILKRLPKSLAHKSMSMFDTLIKAEKSVHGIGSHFHLHEVGQIDSIIDVVGIAIGLEYFNIKDVYCSAIALNRNGFVRCAHGELQLPAPATINILKHATVLFKDSEFELTTPTGAAFLKTFCKGYNTMPSIKLTNTGIGAGLHNPVNTPNIVRFFIGEKIDKRKQNNKFGYRALYSNKKKNVAVDKSRHSVLKIPFIAINNYPILDL